MSKRQNQAIGPGVAKTIEYIKGGIASGTFHPGTILPERNELARLVSVSADTITVAVGYLKKWGILAGVKGQRCRIPERPSGIPADSQRRTAASARAWDAVAGQIRDDITGGAFASGAIIPTSKELCSRYQITYPTLRKALDALVRQRLLVRRGSRYLVPSAALPSARSYILFVWLNIKESPNLPVHEMDSWFICSLERECLRNGVALEKLVASIDSSGGLLLRRPVQTGPVDPRLVEEYGRADPRLVKECAGIVYLVNWFASVNHSVFDWLAHAGKPVSIVDWFGGWDIPPSLAGKPHIQLLRSPVTAKPGFDAGRFLIDRGHRRIAYFSPYALAWPSVRLQGIADACAAAGSSYSVNPFIQHQISEEPEFQKIVLKRYRALEPTLVPPPEFPPDYLSGREHLRATAWLEYENAAHYGTLVPLFEEALAQDGITAWVGCNDAVAMMAWSFLTAKLISVPRRICLMGFGNTIEALKADITSYDFNFEGAVRSIMTFLLRPGLASRIRKLARPHIEGYIIERGSTARRSAVSA